MGMDRTSLSWMFRREDVGKEIRRSLGQALTTLLQISRFEIPIVNCHVAIAV